MIGKRKFLGIAVASLLVASLLGMGAGLVPAPTALAQEAPSVSIDPADSGEVDPGDTFTVDVLVDAGDNSLMGIDVAVDYDADAMTTTEDDIVAPNLLGGMEIGPLVADGEVTYALISTTAVAGVDASVMTITFTINDDAIAGDYDLTITKADLVDENLDPVTVSTNHGTITVSGAAPPGAASVSIIPAAQEVEAGGTFDIDVWVDAGDNSLKGIDVAVEYDADAMSTSVADIVAPNLLGGLEIGPLVADGEVTYALVSTTAVADVDASLMTITFTMDADAEPGDYALTITKGDLVDENVEPVVVEINDGTVTIPGAPEPDEAPSVSIEPDSLTADAGGSFGVDVAVDSSGLLVKACEVTVSFDADDLTATDAIGLPLLGAPVLAIPDNPGIAAGEVTWAVVRTGVNVPAAVEGNFMTINFDVDAAAEGTYVLAIEATLLDENNEPITIVENDGQVIVGIPGGVFEETFTGRLAEGDRDFICVIPAGAANLEINLTATADLDLELYDGATLVVGWQGEIGSAPGGTYEGDDFGYSGYNGGEESITADGPLGQAYDLMVFAYEAGDYTVDVYYEIPVGVDVTPPQIDIEVTASTPTVGEPVTVTVTATDSDSGVAMVMFYVWAEDWLLEGSSSLAAPQQDYEDIIGVVVSFSDVASLTFAPGWAGTYTVDAYAVDNANNMGEETDTFEVLE